MKLIVRIDKLASISTQTQALQIVTTCSYCFKHSLTHLWRISCCNLCSCTDIYKLMGFLRFVSLVKGFIVIISVYQTGGQAFQMFLINKFKGGKRENIPFPSLFKIDLKKRCHCLVKQCTDICATYRQNILSAHKSKTLGKGWNSFKQDFHHLE